MALPAGQQGDAQLIPHVLHQIIEGPVPIDEVGALALIEAGEGGVIVALGIDPLFAGDGAVGLQRLHHGRAVEGDAPFGHRRAAKGV